MILPLFLTLMILSVAVVALGYFVGDSIYTFAGLIFLFLLSMIILTNNLYYPVGETTNSTFLYGVNDTLTNSSIIMTTTYEAWNDTDSHWFGYILAVISFVGACVFLIMETRERFQA